MTGSGTPSIHSKIPRPINKYPLLLNMPIYRRHYIAKMRSYRQSSPPRVSCQAYPTDSPRWSDVIALAVMPAGPRNVRLLRCTMGTDRRSGLAPTSNSRMRRETRVFCHHR
jgi:hypothetical protein